jgi:acetamidase/formamidase
VFVKGALLWSGDSHAAQGNGEINLTALETAYKELNITVDVIKGMALEWPRVETPTHWLSIGYDKDLNVALDLLKAETIKLIAERRKVGAAEAEQIMLKTWDCRVSEVVNVVKGTYCMNPKNDKAPAPEALPMQETARDHVTYGASNDLNLAMDSASMAMINLLQEKRGLSRLDAYSLASMAMDCRIGRPSSAEKVVHCLVPKSLWVAQK